MSAAPVLIVGADSLIGRALAAALRAQGRTVVGTSRRGTPGTVPLDLADDVAAWPIPDEIGAAVLLASVTDQRQCDGDPARSRAVNVVNTCRLAARLAVRGLRVVFPSTNLVLGGDAPWPAPDAPYAPLGVYGAQKAEAEKALLALPGDVAVVRLAKVLDGSLPLIASWAAALAEGRTVRAFSDLIVAPVSLDYATGFLVQVLDSHEHGIFQMSGARELSYCDLACALARRLGRAEDLVDCTTSAEAGVALAASPRHPGLDASRAQALFGLAPQPLDGVLADLQASIERQHAAVS